MRDETMEVRRTTMHLSWREPVISSKLQEPGGGRPEISYSEERQRPRSRPCHARSEETPSECRHGRGERCECQTAPKDVCASE